MAHTSDHETIERTVGGRVGPCRPTRLRCLRLWLLLGFIMIVPITMLVITVGLALPVAYAAEVCTLAHPEMGLVSFAGHEVLRVALYRLGRTRLGQEIPHKTCRDNAKNEYDQNDSPVSLSHVSSPFV